MNDESSKEEILINVTPSEVRAALLENGILQEIFVERAARRGLISNIYKGRVSRVLPGMQAAFIDIGLARTAFLHASDIARGEERDVSEDDLKPADAEEATVRAAPGSARNQFIGTSTFTSSVTSSRA